MKPSKRGYLMPDGTLLQKADFILGCINRDSGSFANRGVTAPRIADLSDGRLLFSEKLTDEVYEGLQSTATGIKDTSRKNLEIGIRTIRNMADVQYDGKGLYNAFGFKDLTRQTDDALVRTANNVHKMATDHLTELADQGLTAPILANLATLTTAFDDAIDAVREAVSNRDIETQKRVDAGNELFEVMMKLASIGKSLFEDTDEAKYNDYVIYDEAPAPAEPVPAP